jgi:RNA polymerase sigma-70 factor (family 1)
MMDYSDDSTLLKEIKANNIKAFEYLFKTYYPRLRGYAIRFVFDEETVHDIIQECFMHLWEKRDKLKALSLPSLLFAMVRNSCLNYLKHKDIVERQKLEYLTQSEGEERLFYVDFFIDAEHKLLYDELKEQIQIVINSLPERSREIFILSRFQGLKNKEIADKLKISTTAVEKHISKALQSFSVYFKDKYPLDIYIIILAWLIQS